MFYKNKILIVLSACLLFSPFVNSKSSNQDVKVINKPNIIFILADDLGYGELGSYGQTKINTPNLDDIANEGMRFNQFYAGSTVCSPSRSSLMTGLHTGHTQIRGNYELGGFLDSNEFGQEPLHPGTQTLATVLKSAGYATALIGKWGLGGPGSYGEPNKQGFDYFYGYLDQKQAHNQTPTHLWRNQQWSALDNTYLDPHPVLSENFDITDKKSFEPYIRSDFSQTRLTEDALEYIANAKTIEKPFFLYVSYTMPHAALQAPEEEIEKYDFKDDHYIAAANQGSYIPAFKPKATRAAMVSLIDNNVGQILQQLREQGLDKNTLVIFTSDNGPSEEGGADINFFEATGKLRGAKRDLYEGGIKVPMLAWWPGEIQAGSETDHVSSFWDVLPTLSQLANVTPTEPVDGISFLPTLVNEKNQKQHEYLYWEFHSWDALQHKQAIRYGQWKSVIQFQKDADGNTNKKVELFNIKADPSEQKELSNKYPKMALKLEAMMQKNRTRSYMDSWNFGF